MRRPSMPRAGLGCGLALSLVACGDAVDSADAGPGPATGESSTSAGATTASTGTDEPASSTGAADESTAGEASTSGDSGTGDTTGGFPPAVCGDGRIEGDEECDDRNDDPDDGCDNDCNASGVVLWTRTWNGRDDDNDLAAGVAVAPDGAVWIAGTSRTGGTRVAFLHRYAPDGSLQLELSLPDGSEQTVTDLALDDTGALYMAGDSGGAAWVVRYDDAGAEQWRYTRDPEGFDELTAVAVAVGPSGVWACGNERQSEGTEGRDAWLVRLDAAGDVAWEGGYAGEPGEDAFGLAIAEAAAGGVVVGGSQAGRSTSFDAWLRLYDADGGVVWTRSESGGGGFTEERVRAVAVDVAGDIVVTGGSETATGERVWTRKYAPDGEVVWTRTWGGPKMITGGGRDLVLTETGDVVIVGELGVLGQGADIFVRRYTGDGDFELWTSRYSGEAMLNDFGSAVAVAPDGSIYAAGRTVVLGQGDDVWLRKLSGE